MYPQRAIHINAPATTLLSALIQAGLVPTGTNCAAVQLQTQHGQPIVRVMTTRNDAQVACSQQVYQALYTLFQDVWRRLDRNAVLCLAAGAPTLAATDVRTASEWLQVNAASSPTQPDSTDAETTVGLVAYGADQLRPLSTPFDAVGLLYGGKPKAGVRVVAIRKDEFGAFLVFDGPGSQGAPVPSREIAEHVLTPLLAEAARHGGAGVLCDVRSQRTYAVSIGAMLSFVARQALPREEPPALNAMIAHVHPLLRDAASEARAWAMSGDPFRKSIAAVLCIVSGLVCAFCFWLMYQMGVMPIYETIRGWAGLSVFDTPDRAITLALLGATTTITVAWVFSWSFTFLELIGVMFGSLPWMSRVLYGSAAVDALINAIYYFRKMLPADLTTKYELPQQLLIGFANLIGACIIGPLMAWFWEAAAVISFVMCVALFPALVWAIGAIVRGSGNTAIRMYFGSGEIFDDWANTRDDLAAHAAGQTQVVFVHGSKPSPRYGLLFTGAALLALIVVGVVFFVMRSQGA